MNEESPGLLARIGSWFRRSKADESSSSTEIVPGSVQNSVIKRPMNRDQAIINMQQGFNTLTDLMSTIKENLHDQGGVRTSCLIISRICPRRLKEFLKPIGCRLNR